MMNNEKIKKIAFHYGFEAQSRQIVEEMAELIVAINKYHRKLQKKDKTPADWIDLDYCKDNIIEEMADVIVMIEQIKLLLAIQDIDVDLSGESKLDRQLERIAKE